MTRKRQTFHIQMNHILMHQKKRPSASFMSHILLRPLFFQSGLTVFIKIRDIVVTFTATTQKLLNLCLCYQDLTHAEAGKTTESRKHWAQLSEVTAEVNGVEPLI